MDDKRKDATKPIEWPGSREYKSALEDILKDQARRSELRDAPPPKSGRPRLHPSVPPILALVSVWLWAFPPEVLRPNVPSIPPAAQEAGLRIEMAIQVENIRQYLEQNGRLPNDLGEVGDIPIALQYVPLGENTFQLSGQSGDIVVEFNSTDPVEDLIGDAIRIVSGGTTAPPRGKPAI